MLINCYYYGPHYHCLLSEHLESDLERIASLGTDCVSLCFPPAEGELTGQIHKRLDYLVDRIRAHGLAVHAVPDRWGRIVAGWGGAGGTLWVLRHLETLVNRGDPEIDDRTCDPEHPAVQRYFETNLRMMIDRYGFDGIVWDEPRPPSAEVARFLDEMSGYVKSLAPDTTVSLFAEAGDLDFVHPLAQTRHMDYLGADGHVRSEEHQMHRMKNTIFTTHAAYAPPLREAGKKTMFLLETQRHRDEDLDDLLANLDAAFDLPMDQLMYYYCAHEMSPAGERRLNEALWGAVAERARRRDKAEAGAGAGGAAAGQ